MTDSTAGTTTGSESPVVVVGVFTVQPGYRQELLTALRERTDQVTASAPGFLSSDLYVGLDGTSVAFHAHWASAQDAENALQSAGSTAFLQRVEAFATLDRRCYQPSSTHTAAFN